MLRQDVSATGQLDRAIQSKDVSAAAAAGGELGGTHGLAPAGALGAAGSAAGPPGSLSSRMSRSPFELLPGSGSRFYSGSTLSNQPSRRSFYDGDGDSDEDRDGTGGRGRKRRCTRTGWVVGIIGLIMLVAVGVAVGAGVYFGKVLPSKSGDAVTQVLLESR